MYSLQGSCSAEKLLLDCSVVASFVLKNGTFSLLHCLMAKYQSQF